MNIGLLRKSCSRYFYNACVFLPDFVCSFAAATRQATTGAMCDRADAGDFESARFQRFSRRRAQLVTNENRYEGSLLEPNIPKRGEIPDLRMGTDERVRGSSRAIRLKRIDPNEQIHTHRAGYRHAPAVTAFKSSAHNIGAEGQTWMWICCLRSKSGSLSGLATNDR